MSNNDKKSPSRSLIRGTVLKIARTEPHSGRNLTTTLHGYGVLTEVTEVPKEFERQTTPPKLDLFSYALDRSVLLTASVQTPPRSAALSVDENPSLKQGTGSSPSPLIARKQTMQLMTRQQLPQEPFLGRICKVVAGRGHVLALTDTGQVWSFGYGKIGQLGLGSTITSTKSFERVRISSSSSLSLFEQERVVYIAANATKSAAVTLKGELWEWGEDVHVPTKHTGVLQNHTIVQIELGQYHSIAL